MNQFEYIYIYVNSYALKNSLSLLALLIGLARGRIKENWARENNDHNLHIEKLTITVIISTAIVAKFTY